VAVSAVTNGLDLTIRGGTVMTPAGPADIDVGVRGGRVVALGDLSRASAATVVEARGLHVLPGVIDSQVHFREPGMTHKEDLETGTRGAVLGGVTAVFEMPNTKPLTANAAALDDKLARARGRAWCDHAFFVGGTPENYAELPALERHPGCCGVKVFMGSSTGDLLIEDDAALDRVIRHGTRRMAVHAEDEPRLKERRQLAVEGAHPRFHPVWRDEETALRATTRLLKLARAAGRRVHVLHVTTAEEMALLGEHKEFATVEVLPQHLTLSAPECYERLGSLAQMNPPIRDQRHQTALWQAVTDGVVDVLGSDHAPHTREEKAKPYPESPSGFQGVQTLLPLMLNHVHAGRLTLQRLIDLTSAGPERIYNIAGKGRIAVGYDADFSLVDLGRRETIRSEWIASRAGWTPFEGMSVTGWPVGTIIRGSVVMRDGELLGRPRGEPVRFQECL
jgi:dihydroorotase